MSAPPARSRAGTRSLAGDWDAVILDVDDTVVDTAGAMVSAAAQAVAELWPAITPEAALEFGHGLQGDAHGWFRRYTRGEADFAAMRRGRIVALGADFGLDGAPVRHSDFWEAYEPHFLGALRVFDDVADLLLAAEAAGVPVGLLTNSSAAYTTAKLAVTGLAERFGAVTSTDTLGFGKPDPRVFAHACHMVGSEPGRTAYAGDDRETDAEGAVLAGLDAHWLVRHGRPDEVPAGVRVVDSLRGLLA